MQRYRSYVICTTPRSGSTLLCRMLAATGIAGDPNSYFHGSSVSEWLSDLDLTFDMNVEPLHVLRSVFDSVRDRGTGDTGIFGLRLQRRSFDFFIRQVSVMQPGLSSDFERFHAVFGRTLFIHLSRVDKLEQAISFLKATQTGLWHMAPDGTELERLSAPQEPVYDAARIAHYLAELRALDEDWCKWFAKENINPLRITYEELSTDPNQTVARVLQRLGMDPGAAKEGRPVVAKMADITNQRWAARFLEEMNSTR